MRLVVLLPLLAAALCLASTSEGEVGPGVDLTAHEDVQGTELGVLPESPKSAAQDGYEANLGESISVTQEMLLHGHQREVKFNGQPAMSLGEIQAEVAGTKQLNGAGLAHFQKVFIKIAKSMNEPRLRESAMLMEQMSEDALTGGKRSLGDANGESQAGGMALVYKRLRQLQDDIRAEAKGDLEQQTIYRSECAKSAGASAQMITDATATIRNNGNQVKEDVQMIKENEANWAVSVKEAGQVHVEFLEIFKERTRLMAEAEIRIDERNKALDVLIQATFIVCTKFRRFRNTEQCIRIKSQPDVDEPLISSSLSVNETAAQIASDKEETAWYEKSMESKWESLQAEDVEKGENPEGWETTANDKVGRKKQEPQEASDDATAEGGEEEATDDSPPSGRLAEANSESEEAGLQDGALSSAEQHSLKSLKLLSLEPPQSSVAVPMAQLVVALKKGKTKKALNLVQVLIDVKNQIHDEQMTDKFELKTALDEFYRRSWEVQAQLQEQKDFQEKLTAENSMRHTRILQSLADNEHQRQVIIEQQAVVGTESSRCAKLEGEFGERDAIRKEDMGNVDKLISLLRALYDQAYPTNCKKGLHPLKEGEEPPLCSGEAIGWCIYLSEKSTDFEQRCSCWPGSYGPACEYTMCPGVGDMMYRHDEEGACSGFGQCNKMTGKCHTCDETYFHGPKEACDLKKCPGSGENEDIMDDKCSGHGSCNIEHGVCTCDFEYSGQGCFFHKCPSSNTVLYPYESPNACDGHGACNFKSGKCDCESPYSGETCQKKACKANCMDRGKCEEATGTCFCEEPFYGPRCEFWKCPDDCTSDAHGWCDANTGKCLCKYGYGGDACKKAHYCEAEGRHTEDTNWYRLWDNPGWALCPDGQGLHALFRSNCETLSCLNSAKCAGLCEQNAGQNATQLEVRHCYHSLSWYESFDQEGWSSCEPNYFVSGLYRSCDSLYCLQMAKCCSFKGARWANCETVDWGMQWKEEGWVQAPANKWITELWRAKGHQLRDMQKAKVCTYAKGF